MNMVDFEAGWGPKIDGFGSKKALQSRLEGMQLAELEAKSLGEAFWTANGSHPIRGPPNGGPWKGGGGMENLLGNSAQISYWFLFREILELLELQELLELLVWGGLSGGQSLVLGNAAEVSYCFFV